MALIRWEPVRELNTIQSEMNRLFNTFFDSPTGSNGTALRRWVPAMDLVETEEDFVLRADLPGLSESDVNIELEDNVLTISGERNAEARGAQSGLLPGRAGLGSFLAVADAARGHRPGRHPRQLRERRTRGPDPEARAEEAAQGDDLRRRRGARHDRGLGEQVMQR
jgi:HSP20 family molecular chaperone IbpA